MPATYEPIATTTLGSAAASITFSSIPATYTDLKLVMVSRSTRSNTVDPLIVQFNGDTTSNYSYINLRGTGSVATTGKASNQTSFVLKTVGDTTGANIFGLQIMDVFSYAGSAYKTVLAQSDWDYNGGGEVEYETALWRSTAAITSIRLASVVASNLAAGTTATLYGILKA
jgi:hypothetical protein